MWAQDDMWLLSARVLWRAQRMTATMIQATL